MTLRESLAHNGYAVVRRLADTDALAQLARLTDTLPLDGEKARGGLRRPFDRIPGLLVAVRETGVPALMRDLLGESAFTVRAILFDKTPDANWSVPWHRDTTIAVAERGEAQGFGAWSIKDGVPHVHAPASVLSQMATIRLHIDACGEESGALRVVPASHLLHDTEQPDTTRATVCTVGGGDAVVMSPLTWHASNKADQPQRRRVLHMECAACELPSPLRWAEAVQFAGGQS